MFNWSIPGTLSNDDLYKKNLDIILTGRSQLEKKFVFNSISSFSGMECMMANVVSPRNVT